MKAGLHWAGPAEKTWSWVCVVSDVRRPLHFAGPLDPETYLQLADAPMTLPCSICHKPTKSAYLSFYIFIPQPPLLSLHQLSALLSILSTSTFSSILHSFYISILLYSTPSLHQHSALLSTLSISAICSILHPLHQHPALFSTLSTSAFCSNLHPLYISILLYSPPSLHQRSALFSTLSTSVFCSILHPLCISVLLYSPPSTSAFCLHHIFILFGFYTSYDIFVSVFLCDWGLSVVISGHRPWA